MESGSPTVGAERLVMTAIELQHDPDCVWEAIYELADARLATLLDILRRAPAESDLARAAWSRAVTPARLRKLIESQRPDMEAFESVLAALGPDEAEPLLDLLGESDALPTRKRVFTRLVELAPHIGPQIVRRLREPTWFTRRNMLVLLGELEAWPARFNPAALADDPHPAVRREAFKLMLRTPKHRDQALCGLLKDPDRRARSLGLAAATESCPPEGVPLLSAIVGDETVTTELRLMGVRALGLTGDRDALEPLKRLVRRGAGLTPNRLAEKSPLMLAALQALATFPGDVGDARKLLTRAARSNDPDVLAALGKERPL